MDAQASTSKESIPVYLLTEIYGWSPSGWSRATLGAYGSHGAPPHITLREGN